MCALSVLALPARSSGVVVGTAGAIAVPAFSTAPISITFRVIRDASDNQTLAISVVAQSDEQNFALPRLGDIEFLLGVSSSRRPIPAGIKRSETIATSKPRLLQVDAKCGTPFNVTGYTTANYMVYSTDAARNESALPGDSTCMRTARGKNSGDLSILSAPSDLVLISSSAASAASEKHLVIVVNFN